jgi:hypothetical protein
VAESRDLEVAEDSERTAERNMPLMFGRGGCAYIH